MLSVTKFIRNMRCWFVPEIRQTFIGHNSLCNCVNSVEPIVIMAGMADKEKSWQPCDILANKTGKRQ